jgi:hypothetical protein
MGSPLDQFDAPELKSAVKRLYAAERAPAGLRQHIETILRAEPAAARPMRIDRWVIWQRAVAALIVLGLSGLIVRANYERRHPVGDETLLAMVRTHDFCCKPTNGHRWNSIPQNDFVLMGQNMASRIKEPVLATDIGNGWTFVGAAMCWVGDKQSAHLVYKRDGQWLSIFSIPASSCKKVRDGGFGGEQLNDHMIAGFARTGGVYCMVGSCPKKNLQLDEIRQLLKKHQADLVPPPPQNSLAMVELLRNR